MPTDSANTPIVGDRPQGFELNRIGELVVRAVVLREQSDKIHIELNLATGAAVTALRGISWTDRDIGDVLGISHERVSEIDIAERAGE